MNPEWIRREEKLMVEVDYHLLGVAGKVTYDTGLGLMLGWSFRRRILSRKARNKV